MNTSEQYPSRDSIDPRAFAVRHMILEEIKTRKLRGDRSTKLNELARAVSVTCAPRDKLYVVSIGNKPCATIPMSEILLYQRGDGGEGRESIPKDDPILASNNQVSASIVDSLLEICDCSVMPSKPTGTQRGRLSLHQPICPECQICGAASGEVRATSLETCEDLRFFGDFKVFECNSCKNMFTHPLPEYASREILPDRALGGLKSLLLRWFMNLRVKRVKSLGTGRELLDFGSGACLFANAMAAAGFEVTAVEPNHENREKAAPGVRIISSLFDRSLVDDSSLKQESFDIVTAWHALEHIPDPRGALQLCFELLKPGGALYLSVPNIASLQASVGGRRWAYLDVPHHVNHFSQRGLIELLNQAGFISHRLFNVSLEYEIFGFHQTILNRLSLSHNYFYNREKKGRLSERDLLYPRWTALVSRLHLLILPVSLLCSALGIVLKRPSCVEVVAYKSAVK